MAEITIIKDFPLEHRVAVIQIASDLGVGVDSLRQAVLRVLFTGINTMDWSYGYIWPQLVGALEECDWVDVYEIAEEVYKVVPAGLRQDYAKQLNRFFTKKGFGWEMRDGLIEYRGAEPFAIATKSTEEVLMSRGFVRAANEVREAMRDISRRPEPDVTGAATHALGALEAVAREDTGKEKTLGQLVPDLALQPPLGEVVDKLWGFASQTARHMSEKKHIDVDEAEFAVTVACALATLVAKRHPAIETTTTTTTTTTAAAAAATAIDPDDLPFE